MSGATAALENSKPFPDGDILRCCISPPGEGEDGQPSVGLGGRRSAAATPSPLLACCWSFILGIREVITGSALADDLLGTEMQKR